ncbi:hypothetical protein BT96DRAFT_916516 [Gymnopus androsaceus JB14]|uniref:Serine/threonine-protein phosphatase 4 regulatory subunit 3-like central domain-containing protein n=1 Tax=Gymnopus androsaceus JB14 TaxID=1447944 RepID=A0A6A4I4L3_9AGAR|nr:hypothetical protein BT96DRAFT_916516 [Gymnopus androsaceus JB14]
MLNDYGIYEQIPQDEYFVHVCGMLEYDPDFPTHKANYRQLLGTRFHSPIPSAIPPFYTYRL